MLIKERNDPAVENIHSVDWMPAGIELGKGHLRKSVNEGLLIDLSYFLDRAYVKRVLSAKMTHMLISYFTPGQSCPPWSFP